MKLPSHDVSASVEVLRRTDAFADLSPSAQLAIAQELVPQVLAAGDQLTEQGKGGDALWVVDEGLLVVRSDAEPAGRRLGLLARGSVVGEGALLTGGERNASVYALRDSRLLRMDEAAFHRMLARQPDIILPLVRLVLGRQVPGRSHSDPRMRVVTIVPIDGSVSAEMLLAHLEGAASVMGLRHNRVDVEAGEDLDAAGLFSGGEDPPDVLFVDARGDDSWRQKAIRNADRVLLAADPSLDPRRRPVEAAIEQEMRSDLPPYLVLLGKPPRGLLDWTPGRDNVHVQHVNEPRHAEELLAGLLESHPDLGWLARTELFEGFNPALLTSVAARFQLSSLVAGEALFEAGSPADSLYVLVEGRLAVDNPESADGGRTLLTSGAIIGEMGVLADEARLAGVRAARDSVIAKLPRADFDAILQLEPEIGRRLASLVVQRLTPSRSARSTAGNLVIAAVRLDDTANVRTEVGWLADSFGELGKTMTLDRHAVEGLLGAGGADLEPGSASEPALIRLLTRQEEASQHLLLVADATDTEWTRRCLRQADVVLLFADAKAPPTRRPIEQALWPEGDYSTGDASVMLVLVHLPGTRHGRGTADWLDERHLDRWAHVVHRNRQDLDRLARRVTGRAVGLTLSGGGSRGAAHLGVVEALYERGIPIDCVSGTSAGAAVAGLVAQQLSMAAATGHVEALLGGVWGHLASLGPPIVSLMSGHHVQSILEPRYADLAIEDLPIPLAVAASDVVGAESVAIRRGSVWEAVRASSSVPGLWPPVVRDGRPHVDGGVLNNLPAEYLHHDCRYGAIIASDVGGADGEPPRYETNRDHRVSGWRVLWEDKLLRHRHRRTNLGSTVVQSMLVASSAQLERTVREHVDVLIQPSMPGIGMFELRGPERVAWAAGRGHAAAASALDKYEWTPEAGLTGGAPGEGPQPAAIPSPPIGVVPPDPQPTIGNQRFQDAHGAVLRGLLMSSLRDHRPTDAADISPPLGPAEPALPTMHCPLIGEVGVELALSDEDVALRSARLSGLVDRANRFLPMRDLKAQWRSEGECESAQSQLFEELLPQPHVKWASPTGADALALFARQGMAAHRLEASSDGGFVLDLDELAPYPVRSGYVSYGGVLTLDERGQFRSLVRNGETISPNDSDFEHEAFAFRTSALLLVTILDHLGLCHYGLPNTLLLAVRRTLPAEHPLRCFLRPFLFRTAAINHGAVQSLLPKRALLHRASALQWDGLQDLYRLMRNDVRFEPLPERLRAQGTHPTQLGRNQDVLPWSADGVDWYEGLGRFVDDALENSRGLASVLSPPHATATHRFYEALSFDVRNLPAIDISGLAATLTWLLHVVSALHGHVGHVAPYVRHPRFAAGRVAANAVWAERQNTLQISTVAVLTGLPMPSIADPWHGLMPDPEATQAAARFGQWLDAFQAEIDSRNEARQQPFSSFSPRHIPCSVSR